MPLTCPQAVCNPQIDPNTNKLIGYVYDGARNTIVDAQGRGFSYDAENKQTEVRDGNNIVVGRYYYDGDGKRIKKVSNTETVIFVYDAGGKMIAEYSNQTNATPQISYLTSDHLGSPRIITDGSGNVTSRRDFQPFGEEVRTWYRVPNLGYAVADNVRQKFTGYERDTETNLDYAKARMFESGFGRFTSPDPLMASARKRNPQTFNRYSYVINNPLNLIDPIGLKPCPPGAKCDENDEEIIVIEGKYDPKTSVPGCGGVPCSSEYDPPSAEFQGPLPQNPILPNPSAQPQTAPSESSGSKFASNVVRSMRSSGPVFAASLVLNELAYPSQSVGNDTCDAVPDGCKEDPEDGYFSRIATPGQKAFQLRQGEDGLSVFQQNGIYPPVTDPELLSGFRPGSIIVRVTAQEVRGLGLTIVQTPGDPRLPARLQIVHFEIRQGAGMSRNEFKKVIKSGLP